MLGRWLRLIALIGLVQDVAAAPAAGPPLVVVVHPSRTEPLTREDVSRIFLRRRRFWNDGSQIVPLNREPGSRPRELFSTLVLGEESRRLAAYWNERYFQGVFPPTVLSSAAAVKRYVASDARAIGYLEEDDVDASVRVALKLSLD